MLNVFSTFSSQLFSHAAQLRASTRWHGWHVANDGFTKRHVRAHFVTRPAITIDVKSPGVQSFCTPTPVELPVTDKFPSTAQTVSNDTSVLERPYIVRVADWLRTQRELEATGRKKKPRGRLVARQRRETAFRTLIKGWRRLSAEERQARENDFLLRSEVIAWSLNFDAETERLIRKNARPANYLANKIQRLAKSLTGAKIPITLVLEETEEGRLHAHGMVILENWSRDTVRNFSDLLRRAGGRSGGACQAALRKLFSATGWRNYITKVMPRTIANLGSDSITYTSREITSLAREDYGREFKRQKAVRTRRAAAHGRQSPSPVVPALSEALQVGMPGDHLRSIFRQPNARNDTPVAARFERGRGTRRHNRRARSADRRRRLSPHEPTRGRLVQAQNVRWRGALAGFQTRRHSSADPGIFDGPGQPALLLGLDIGESTTAPFIDAGQAASERRFRGRHRAPRKIALPRAGRHCHGALPADRWSQASSHADRFRRAQKPTGERNAVAIGTSRARLMRQLPAHSISPATRGVQGRSRASQL